MIFSKKILAFSFIIILAGLVVFFVFFLKGDSASSTEPSPESAQSSAKPDEMPLPVRVVPAKRGDLVIKLKVPGEAVTRKKIAIKTDISGVIKKLNVEESQHVKQGELLVELDDREYRLELERAEASRLKVLSELLVEKRFGGLLEGTSPPDQQKIERIKKEYEKAKELYHKGLISGADFEKASTDYELAMIEAGQKKEEILAASKGLTQAEIEVERAKLNLEKTKIRAPFSGIITDIKISPEEHLTSSRELFTLVDIRRLQVQAKVLESEIGRIGVGREVEIKFSAFLKVG